MHRRAQKALAAAALIFLAVNSFLSFSSWSEDLAYNEYDPSEVSRRLDGKQPITMRDRIINSLGQRRGVKPGDPEFQRLFLARLSDMQKQSEIPAARRIALRTLEQTQQNIWMRPNKEPQKAPLEQL